MSSGLAPGRHRAPRGAPAPAAPVRADGGAVDPQERVDALLGHLGTRAAGLSDREARRRLTQYGPNTISRSAEVSRLGELVRQFVHPLALLLWIAAGLAEGDRSSADARLIGGSLELDMAPLTGESQPVVRSATAQQRAVSVLEADDLVFAGTLCTAGEAEAVVYATAMSTQIGRIAALSQRVKPEISPLQAQVNRVAWMIAAIAMVAGVVFFIAGISLAGLSLAAAVTFAIGLLVANVPEGLLPTITLSLAGGVRRMAARRALVKRLTAVETLGSTDVICTDKTGTLTEESMSVRMWWSAGRELPMSSDDGGPAPDAFAGLLLTASTSAPTPCPRWRSAASRPSRARWTVPPGPARRASSAAPCSRVRGCAWVCSRRSW